MDKVDISFILTMINFKIVILKSFLRKLFEANTHCTSRDVYEAKAVVIVSSGDCHNICQERGTTTSSKQRNQNLGVIASLKNRRTNLT